MVTLENIAEVVSDGLCTGCGACVGVCPTNAIQMHLSNSLLLPCVDDSKCVRCLKCVQCCSGHSLDLAGLNSSVFGKQPEDILIGSYSNCYLGHSNDAEVTSVSSSGGIVEQVLIYLLENRLIDYALTARAARENPLMPESSFASTREEILSSSGSKYCPVATDVALKKIMAEDKKFAFVGLPCHIHSLRKAERVFKGLRGKIVLHIGLFCGHTVNFDGTFLVLKKLAVSENEVARLRYRGNEHPDHMLIELRDGQRKKIRFNRNWNAYWNLFAPFFFTPVRCLMCPDHFNELADMSVGDAWLQELRNSSTAESIVVSRTEIAEKTLVDMRTRGLLTLKLLSQEKVKASQAFSLNFKKENLPGRLSFFRALGKSTPTMDCTVQNSSKLLGLISGFLSYLSFRVSSSKHLSLLLLYVPLPIFRLYFGFFVCVFQMSTRIRS